MACPTCGGHGESYRGTPKAEVRHFIALVIWGMHRARQAMDALGRRDRANLAGALIREIEELAVETNTGEEPTN